MIDWCALRDSNLRRIGGVSEAGSGERESPAEIPSPARDLGDRMARPDRFELPTFWLLAVAARRISNLYRARSLVAECYRCLYSKAFQRSRDTPWHSVGIGGGHKTRHSGHSDFQTHRPPQARFLGGFADPAYALAKAGGKKGGRWGVGWCIGLSIDFSRVRVILT